ncbi:hypothetical protein EIP86_000574 [Pleurotus ostreatoroseus]|nr:hypothetical protein EIP86_000574 [Pleurotus ostreatoroseus]
MSVQIQILSDLHLEIERPNAAPGQEFYHFDVPARAEILALLGDIGCTVHEQLFDWLKVQLRQFKTVIFLSGNHEPYRTSLVSVFAVPHSSSRFSHITSSAASQAESEARLRAFADDVASDPSISGEFVYLNRTRYDLSPTLTVLGCTLWAALNLEDLDILSWALQDFRRIDGFDPTAYIVQHRQDLTWLNETVQSIARDEPHRCIVVFTHHAPTVLGTGDPKFDGQPTNSAFATELSGEPCWKPGTISLWAFGHTHWCCDFERNGVRVYSNMRGSGEGAKGFDPTKVVTIP